MESDGSSTRDERRRARKRLRRQVRVRERALADNQIDPPASAPPALRVEEAGRSKHWRWSSGRLTFFNRKPRTRYDSPVVHSTPLEAQTLPTALVSRMKDPALPPGTFSCAVYRNDGTILPEFLAYDELTQHRKFRRLNAPVVDRARIEDAARIDGTCIYLGSLSSHFGHFLLESLARAWYLIEADPSLPIVFHNWNEKPNLAPFASAFLKALEVDPSRIRVVAGRDIRVGRLVFPSSQFWQGVSASHGMCVVFDHMREKMLQSRTGSTRTPAKVYLSRRGLGGERVSGEAREAIANEEEAEALFRDRGYEILRPESLPIEEQVAIVANATHVAGPSGSALHLMLFNANPQARLIELRTKPAFNQLLISAIRGNEAFHISCRTKEGSSDGMLLNMDVVERAVREIDG